MERRSDSCPLSPWRRLPDILLPTCIFPSHSKPRSPARKKIRHGLNSPMSSSTELDRERDSDSNFRSLKSPRSPRRALRRLINSVSKNSVKLAATFSPRKYSSSSPPLSSSPKSEASLGEAEAESEEMIRELSAVFRHFDTNGDGKISWEELRSALNSVGEEVGENELREIIKELDSEGDGYINMEGFIRLNMEQRGADQAEKELMAAFRMFEEEDGRSGGITPGGLQRMMSRLGVGDEERALTLEHCSFIISKVDLDGDGVVNFQEFKRMMTATVH